MKQKVKNISYLCVVKFTLDEASKALAFIPSGAEVISLNLEIIEPLTNATSLNIGLDKQEDYFLKDIKADTKGFHQSSVLLSANTNQIISATITDPAKVKKEVETETENTATAVEVKPTEPKLGLACLRVHYFFNTLVNDVRNIWQDYANSIGKDINTAIQEAFTNLSKKKQDFTTWLFDFKGESDKKFQYIMDLANREKERILRNLNYGEEVNMDNYSVVFSLV
ncbi:hypothetical protein NHP190033_09030 [Helicobacter suis]|uniref:hypothetical protein n=5 Tax=Helicobacter suis TaxID=104628 RepID=UPI00158130E5|nr:hypothetical protein [Helicobacter suis]GFK16727.1 hypothetical protein NHP190033_09030 [Helicobacter suis]